MGRAAAILFDFDGVIVDSERLHHATMAEALAGIGPAFDWEYYRENLMGLDDRGAFAHLLARAGREASPDTMRGLIADKAERFARMAEAGRVPAYAGAVDLIRSCAAAGPVGLCSGALRSDVVPVLGALGLAECFAELVTADDVERSKPDPACYALCVRRLAARFPGEGIAPETCVAVEDTCDGIAAARGAGIAVLGVASNVAPEALRAAGAARVAASLAGLAYGDVASVIG